MIAIVLVVVGITTLMVCCAGIALNVLRLLYYILGFRLLACLVLVLWFAYHAAPVSK